MSRFGAVDRIYLTPESRETREKRVRAGGARANKFTDGWVEFLDKKVAKLVALSLNNTPIGINFS
jgi:ESF2/ABP1 family protein